MDKIQSTNRRRYLRYRPDPLLENDLAKRAMDLTGFVDRNLNAEAFNPRLAGLITDKSHSGCSIAILCDVNRLDLDIGSECLVKAGLLAPLKAIVRWHKLLEESLVKVGFEFTE